MASLNAHDFITLARVLKTQGRRGDLAVAVHSDVPNRLGAGLRLFALADGGARHELKVEAAWAHKGFVVLKFVGVDSIADAGPLVGCELQVPLIERAPLQQGATYISDLLGCVVFDGGREVGTVKDVRFGAGEAPLLVVGAGKSEREIPYAQEFLTELNLERKRIEMNLPEGLLEVNAPLTDEEKRRQSGRTQ